jgi:hypothetical protein
MSQALSQFGQLKIGCIPKAMFFDRLAVQNAVKDSNRRNLSKFGDWVRKSARWSIRPRKAVSEPGQPPSSHTGLLRRNIFFAYEPKTQNVVIGPVPIHQLTFNTSLNVQAGIVPEILEYGGSAGVIESAFRDQAGGLHWQRRDLRRYGKVAVIAALRANMGKGQYMKLADGNFVVPTGHNRFRTYRVKARPYMHPAFDKGREQIPALWADSIKKRS